MDEQKQYAKKLINLQSKKEREIRQIYFDAILDITAIAASLPYRNTIFSLALYPILRTRVDYILKRMVTELKGVIVNGIDQAWTLSDQKNKVFLDKNLKGFTLSEKARKIYYDTNAGAKKSFTNRQIKGLDLSKRIWKAVKPFQNQLEVGVATGIATGQSAAKMANSIQKNLNEPDKLFRKVVDMDGRIKLSKAAKEYQPGQGVYRSSFKNALRLARTETNMAYRAADWNRWHTQDFVVGIEVQLSAAHPRKDICDALAGKYPKDFKFPGWHSQCICFQTPILITHDEMDKSEEALFKKGKWDGKSVNTVHDAPATFYRYLEENADKINGLSSTPYWVQDNTKYMKSLDI